MLKRPIALLCTLALLLAACGDDDSAADSTPVPSPAPSPTAEPPTAEPPTAEPPTAEPATAEPPTAEPATAEPEGPGPLRILVTNDDGVGARGIDVLVDALAQLPDVELTVVAPAENQSGSGDTLSEGPVVGVEATTASGFPATAVMGTPGDSVLYALTEVVDETPHLIVSGSNEGENIGPFASVSGTVGAARIGAREGIPGLAVSQGGVTVDAEFELGVPFAVAWIADNRDQLQAHEPTGLGTVVSINTPSCAETGELRGILETELDDDFGEFTPFDVDCSTELSEVATDVEAFFTGYATLTVLPEALVAGEPTS